MKKRRIVFFGGKALGLACLRLLEKQAEVILAVSNTSDLSVAPDRWYPCLRDFCQERSIPYEVCENPNRFLVPRIASLAPDLIFVAYHDAILSASLLEIPPMGGINVHMGDIRRYRGAHPTTHAILDGAEIQGCTIHRMTSKIDAGEVLAYREFQIPPDCTGRELYTLATVVAAGLVRRTLPKILAGKAPGRVFPLARLRRRCEFPEYEVAVPPEAARKIRALTFAPFPAPRIRIGSKTFEIREVKP